MIVDIDPRFRDQFEQLLARNDLVDLDGLMSYPGHFDELPLFAMNDEVAFLAKFSPEERSRILIRAAVAHLGVILDHSRKYYEGREYDYFCAVTVTDWEYLDEGGAVVPHFWYANPSRGVFDHLKLDPPASEQSRFVAKCLDHSPDYVLNDDLRQSRLERVWVQHVSCLAPIKEGGDEA